MQGTTSGEILNDEAFKKLSSTIIKENKWQNNGNEELQLSPSVWTVN